jgi:hypothetical protein
VTFYANACILSSILFRAFCFNTLRSGLEGDSQRRGAENAQRLAEKTDG